MTETKRKTRAVRVGVVASDKADKTIKVVMAYSIKHHKYGKYVRRRTHVQAHDPDNTARVGDTVEIMECRPISKIKSWRLVKVIK